MMNGKTLVELAEELDRQAKAKKDYLLDTRSMVMDPVSDGFNLTLSGDSQNLIVKVNDIAHEQIAAKAGIPMRYYDKMRTENPELLVENVNSWFQKEPETRMVRTLDGTARAFLSDRYRRIDHYQIAETVLPVIGEIEGARVESCEITDRRMYIKVVNPKLTTEVSVGDVVQSGILITNSEVGCGSLCIVPLVYRLVCSNGMVVNDARTRKFHVGRTNTADDNFLIYSDETLIADDKALMLKVRDTVRTVVDEVRFEKVVNMMRVAQGEAITSHDIPKMVELASADYKLSQAESSGVLDHLIRDGEYSLYGLANAVTRTAQDVKSYDRSTELEAIGYNMLGMSPAAWRRLNDASAA